jgi:ketosteroid isomerase-like protein
MHMEEELESRVQRLVEAVRTRDVEGMVGAFASELWLGVIFGAAELFSPHALRTFAERVASAPTDFDLALETRAFEEAGGTAVLIMTGTFIEQSPGEDRLETPYRLTAVFRRHEGAWEWVHCHGSTRIEF